MQRSYAYGHLVLKVQPDGGFAGLGKSPCNLIFSTFFAGSLSISITGIEEEVHVYKDEVHCYKVLF